MSDIPSDLNEAVDLIVKMLSDKDKKTIKNRNHDIFYYDLGHWVRNNWGLWNGSILRDYFFSLGIFHADDMSYIILYKVQALLREETFILDDEVSKCIRYWEKLNMKPLEEIKKLLNK